MTAVGVADPVPATRALMALSDGLLLHRLTVDPELDLRPLSNERCAPSRRPDIVTRC
jgi:hypothetical protein